MEQLLQKTLQWTHKLDHDNNVFNNYFAPLIPGSGQGSFQVMGVAIPDV